MGSRWCLPLISTQVCEPSLCSLQTVKPALTSPPEEQPVKLKQPTHAMETMRMARMNSWKALRRWCKWPPVVQNILAPSHRSGLCFGEEGLRGALLDRLVDVDGELAQDLLQGPGSGLVLE